MKIKFNQILIGLLSLSYTHAWAQNQDMGLSIGDSLPSFKIPKTIFSDKVLTTEMFKNRLLIIDFWGLGCTTCIESLPKMEKLEEKFGSRLKILPVTYGKENVIRNFWKSNKYTKYLKGCTVVEDTLFSRYFKHKYIPHEVWIYKGKIIGITSLDYVDEYNIRKVLNGEMVEWPLKNDFNKYDMSKPLFTLTQNQSDIPSEQIRSIYAAVGGFRKGVNSPLWLTGGSDIVRDKVEKTVRTYFLNQPILNSYLLCYFKLLKVSDLVAPQPSALFANQISWKVKDKTKYVYEKQLSSYQQNWLIKHGICFEAVYPDTGQKDTEVYRSMILDLDRLLGLKVTMQKNKEEVLILKDSSSPNYKPAISNKGVEYSLYDIFYNFNNWASNPYLFNEVKNLDVVVKLEISSWGDIQGIKKGLEAVGIEVKAEQRIIDKLYFIEN